MDENVYYERACNNEEVPTINCETFCCIDCEMQSSCVYVCTDIYWCPKD